MSSTTRMYINSYLQQKIYCLLLICFLFSETSIFKIVTLDLRSGRIMDYRGAWMKKSRRVHGSFSECKRQKLVKIDLKVKWIVSQGVCGLSYSGVPGLDKYLQSGRTWSKNIPSSVIGIVRRQSVESATARVAIKMFLAVFIPKIPKKRERCII